MAANSALLYRILHFKTATVADIDFVGNAEPASSEWEFHFR
jgi:hypothetical protein